MNNHSNNYTLYKNLLNLVETTDAFNMSSSVSIGGGHYRVFSYRLASYSDFLLPDAFEARGTMFEVTEDGEFIRLAARTPSKFFNAYENPFVMFDEHMLSSELEVVMDKLDGSIISTFMDTDGCIRTKSHTSLHSEHAYNSTSLLNKNKELQDAVLDAETNLNCTVNMEYTSPEYRIVLPYQTDELTVLNIRNKDTGELFTGDKLKQVSPVLYKYSVSAKYGNIDSTFPMKTTLKESINAVREMTGVEGFVGILKDGRMFKIKTDWYCSLHFNKDSINVDSRLYEAVLNGASDDLRQMFSTDNYCLQKIDKMENLVFMFYNKLQADIEDFVENNKHLERKEYALKVQQDLSKELNRQGLAFALYNGKSVNYKETMLKYVKDVLVDF